MVGSVAEKREDIFYPNSKVVFLLFLFLLSNNSKVVNGSDENNFVFFLMKDGVNYLISLSL